MIDNRPYSPIAKFDSWKSLTAGESYRSYLALLDDARENASPQEVESIRQTTIREAALESGAIEGLYATNRGVTETIATLGASWEMDLQDLGPDAPALFRAQMDAFELVVDAVTNATPVSEAWIRQLHQKATSAQATYRVRTPQGYQLHRLEHGQYKVRPNNVGLGDGGVRHYAPVDQVSSEMHKLVDELRSKGFLAAHPVLQASYAHHALVAIHPFSDGNGRVARSLASVFLFRGPGIPLVIFSDQSLRYWGYLAGADKGELQGFVNFIDDRVLDAMMLFTQRLKAGKSSLDRALAEFKTLARSHGDLSQHELQAVGSRLFDRIHADFVDNTQTRLPPEINSSVHNPGGTHQCNFGTPHYRTLPSGGLLKVILRFADPPVDAGSEVTAVVGVSVDPTNRFAFIVTDASRPARPPLELRLNELHPTVVPAADMKIKGWVEGSVGAALEEINRGIANKIESS